MYKKLSILAVTASLFAGCASVPMESKENDALAKQFNPPSEGNAGLYIYRAGGPGTALKKDIWVDKECVGETAPHVFFYHEVEGNKEHEIATESEFSPNDLVLYFEAGKNYFIKQFIKIGLLVGGADLELVSEGRGKEDVSELELAIKGNCSQ